jgi:hypothetical protein
MQEIQPWSGCLSCRSNALRLSQGRSQRPGISPLDRAGLTELPMLPAFPAVIHFGAIFARH